MIIEQEKERLFGFFNRKIKTILRRIQNIQEALNDCSTWEHVLHEGELLKANYSMLKKGGVSITVLDWESNQERTITTDPKKTPQELVALRFKRARKLQAGSSHLLLQLEKYEKALKNAEECIQTISTFISQDEIDAFRSKIIPEKKPKDTKKTSEIKALPYHEYVSAAGLKILVGKNGKANDKLTFIYANGSDWWLHVQGYPGSHVVVKSRDPDEETLADAMQLALLYSKAKECGEGEICLTQRKYLSRLGKQAGKVQVSKHKTIWIRTDPQRIAAIKQRRSDAVT